VVADHIGNSNIRVAANRLQGRHRPIIVVGGKDVGKCLGNVFYRRNSIVQEIPQNNEFGHITPGVEVVIVQGRYVQSRDRSRGSPLSLVAHQPNNLGRSSTRKSLRQIVDHILNRSTRYTSPINVAYTFLLALRIGCE